MMPKPITIAAVLLSVNLLFLVAYHTKQPSSFPEEHAIEQQQTYLELLRSNFHQQPYTALLRVTSVSNHGVDQGQGGGYLNYELHCEVMATFKGKDRERIDLSYPMEWTEGMDMPRPPAVGSMMLVSLEYYDNGKEPGQYIIPDNGYELPAEQYLIEEAIRLKNERLQRKQQQTLEEPLNTVDVTH